MFCVGAGAALRILVPLCGCLEDVSVRDRPSTRSGAFDSFIHSFIVFHATETVPPMMVSQLAFLLPFLGAAADEDEAPSENRRDPLRVLRELAPLVLMLRWLVLCMLPRELMLRMLRELRRLPESEEFMLEMEL